MHRRGARLLALLLVAAAAGWWYAGSGLRTGAPPTHAVATQVTQPLTSHPQVVTPVANVPVTATAVTVPVPVVAASVPVSPSVKATVSQAVPIQAAVKAAPPKPVVPRQTAAMPSVAAPVAVPVAGAATESLRMESSLMRLPAAAKVAAPAANWRTAALETLAQAQSLWSAGSHTAAIELRGQAFSRVGNTTPLGTPVITQSPFASLARELARMQLADGQVGRQTAAAGEWARKARVMGALRPDVANYLRQLGVIIRFD